MRQPDGSPITEPTRITRTRRSGWQALGVGTLTLLLFGLLGVYAGSEIAVKFWGTDCSGYSDSVVWLIGGSPRGWCELGNMDQVLLGAAVGVVVALVLAVGAGIMWRLGPRREVAADATSHLG